MLFFGHTGITLAAAVTVYKIAVNRGMGRISELLDYRLVLVGSILPDLIDKPLGHIILRESVGNGRLFAHTLLFLLTLFSLGLFCWRRFGSPGVLILAGGSFFHQILDSMWSHPETLLWPAYGLSFPKGEPEGYFWHVLNKLMTDPFIYVPELMGALIVLGFLIRLIYLHQIRSFVETGRIAKSGSL